MLHISKDGCQPFPLQKLGNQNGIRLTYSQCLKVNSWLPVASQFCHSAMPPYLSKWQFISSCLLSFYKSGQPLASDVSRTHYVSSLRRTLPLVQAAVVSEWITTVALKVNSLLFMLELYNLFSKQQPESSFSKLEIMSPYHESFPVTSYLRANAKLLPVVSKE